jgi:Fe-S cluster assembly scaffold protein SufB
MIAVKEYEAMLEAYGRAGADPRVLRNSETGNLVVHENKVLKVGHTPGLRIETHPTASGVNVALVVAEGARLEHPVHLCFGVLPREGLQEILLRVEAQAGSELTAVAHCLFPNAVDVTHRMDADIRIGDGARFSYRETHYHGEAGGIRVVPKGRVSVGKKGVWQSTFALIEGCVGVLDYDFDVFGDESSISELTVKVSGKKKDEIDIVEKIHLDGQGARGLAKSRLVLSDDARAMVRGETYGNAPFARGHIDCMEVVNGDGVVASAVPVVHVNDRRAKVTHEAAIGSIDSKQMQTLMARGLSEEEAVDVIVRGILR